MARRILCTWLIICLVGLSGCNKTFVKVSATPTPIINLYMRGSYGTKTPEEIARELELSPQKTYDDFIDLGVAYIWMGEYLKAAEAFEMAARQAPDKSNLVGALYNKAGALAYVDLSEALRTIDLAAKLAPGNYEIARLRYGLYLHSGDSMGRLMAWDHIAECDPSLHSESVGLPLAVVGLTAILVVGGVVPIVLTALVPPEDRAEVVKPLMEGYGEALGEAGKAAGETLGTLLIKEALSKLP